MEQIATKATAEFLDPSRIVRHFDLEKGDHVADFGAGHGYFTIPIARAVGGEGKVYAIDIQKSVLAIIRAKARHEHLLNIETVWADLDQPGGSRLKDRFLDTVVIANILFQAEAKGVILQEAFRILREKGTLVLIEWDPDTPSPLGPPLEMRLRKEHAKSLALQSGFAHVREFDAGAYHYGLLFRRP